MYGVWGFGCPKDAQMPPAGWDYVPIHNYGLDQDRLLTNNVPFLCSSVTRQLPLG